jgi:hypothetical protein
MAGIRATRILICLSIIVLALPLVAQQTGGLGGRVTAVDGSALPGVTVEARSNVLPQPRVTTTTATGDYRIPALPPGAYTLTFSLAGMETRTRNVQVLLGQEQNVSVALGLAGLSESITVTAEGTLIDTSSTEIRSAVGTEAIESLPVGQTYRDLLKLLPAVQYTEETIRGPSAGGSGQDNVYQFDGVNISLPLYGTLSAEPSSHDIQQISVIKGGARAVDFVRSAGFTMDSVSKSGTNAFAGEVSYQIRTEGMTSDRTSASAARFEEDRSWLTANFGGPLIAEQLFFYTSYYRPEVDRENRSNVYGEVPDYRSTRDEYFGKLTYTPLASVLIHGSYRHSDRTDVATGVASGTSAGTTSSGGEGGLRIGILEGSWVISDRSYATFKGTDFTNETASRPDLFLNVTPSLAPGTRLDLANLASLGRFQVPVPSATNAAAAAYQSQFVQQYGYLSETTGARTGGGFVGAGRDVEQIDFFRRSYQGGYNHTFGTNVAHDVHVGYQWFRDREDFFRVYNGWGDITVQGGATNCPAASTCAGQPIFLTSRIIRGGLPDIDRRNIISDYESQNFEVNDTIRMNDWTFNVGVLVSSDTLYGQGLRADRSTISGYVLAPGNKYAMKKIGWSEMVQPRLGATWAYNGQDNVYANYSRYYPSVSSLPRAASWDRNNVGLFYDVYFDAAGNLIGHNAVGSSTGKLFVDDIKPRYTDEYLIGTSQQFTPAFTARAYGRYRYSTNFWEDTNNDARVAWAPEGYPKELYMPDAIQKYQQIATPGAATPTNRNIYVIAQLDGAFTKYYEATLESDWRVRNTFLRGSYTWSQYYGNMDQDNTSTNNDLSIFVGSSNIADGPGRQIWDNKYGWLRGDRRHLLKLYGYYNLPWNGTVGAFGLYQSGQPWEEWSFEPYRTLPGFSGSSDLIRYAEPAGSRRSPDHYQVDLTYTQNVPIQRYNVQLQLDMFNVFDRQTGYSYQPARQTASFGQPRLFFEPRRYQVALKFLF